MTGDLRRPPRPGERFLVMADLVTFRVTCADSAGRLAVVELEAPPGGGPPPMHTHPPDEVFHVIDGQVTLYVGQPGAIVESTLRAGESGHVAGGVPHTFRNFGENPARLLLVFSPGEVMERFFAEAGHPIADPHDRPQIDLAAEVGRVFAIGRPLGLELLSPPPGP